MSEAPTITALAQWFGSNRRLGHAVGEALAGCRWVGIPFAGGMSELLHITARAVVVSDIHRHVINLAKVCAHPQLGPELYRRLRRLPFHPEVLQQAQERCRAWENSPETWEPVLDWAVDYFVAVWMNRAGVAGTKGEFSGRLSVGWKAGGDSSARYRSATRSIMAWRSVFRRCTFVSCDCFAFLGKVRDLPQHGVYCDPPFLGPGARYKHTFTEQQHRDLASALSRFMQTRVVCRFYDHPTIRRLYPEEQWEWHRLVGRTQTNAEAPEVLLVNRQGVGGRRPMRVNATCITESMHPSGLYCDPTEVLKCDVCTQ